MAIINVDPTGPMPLPDGNGQVVLNETKGNLAATVFGTFLFSAAALVSLLYWAEYLFRGHVLVIANQVFGTIVKFGFLALPALPFLFGEVLSPPCLTMNGSGVNLRRRGVSKNLPWVDLTEINLQLRVIRDRNGGFTSRTYCYVLGHSERLILSPIFGVSPATLAAYLQGETQRQTGGFIPITQAPHPAASSPAIIRVAVIGIMGMAAIACLLLIIWRRSE